MKPRPRLAIFSLPLLLICCFLSPASQGTDGRGAERTSVDHSPGHQEKTQQPSQAADAQSPAKDSNPLFPVVDKCTSVQNCSTCSITRTSSCLKIAWIRARSARSETHMTLA
jgi:hypothetical protein